MPKINEAKIAILATHGFERSELHEPLNHLRDKGAKVDIVSLEEGEITSWKGKDWDDKIGVDKRVTDANVADYDALVLPGGVINPDILRANEDAVSSIRDFAASGKVVAAICHGPWLLVEADVVRGRDVTSYHSIKTDLINAGGKWHDREVVVDNGIITSRKPSDLAAFNNKIVEEIEEGRHARDVQAA